MGTETRGILFFLDRVEGLGIIGGHEAVNWGLCGPML